MSRQLAAILFSDIVGYTTLMGKDSSRAIDLVRISVGIQKPLVEKHKGKWLKEMGDGAMAQFGSALDAVQCAIEIQEQARARLDAKLRIGIHLGDITIENDDIYGDGVNVASRIEALAEPGGIYISQSVSRAIKGESISTLNLGEKQLKNVDGSVQVFAVQGVGLPVPGRRIKRQLSTKLKAVLVAALVVMIVTVVYLTGGRWYQNKTTYVMDRSIAVLPFTDMSPNQDQEYLGDGIAEEIINLLVRINGLRVIGRTSSFSFKGKNLDLRTIGGNLGVGTILEGSIRKSRNTIRVTAQLIDAQDGSHLWSETYERDLSDIFKVQDEIAQQVAGKFRMTLELLMSENPPTENIEAYENFLRAKKEYFKGLAGANASIELLETATQLDPEFDQAYSLLAEANWVARLYGLGDLDVRYEKARNAALMAISVDPDSYHGFRVLSMINFYVEWNWEEALENYQRAIDLGMPLPDRYQAYFDAILGNIDQGTETIRSLLENDPQSVEYRLDLTRMYIGLRDFDGAIKAAESVLELDPENTSSRRHLGSAYLFSGNPEKALEYYQDLLQYDSMYAPYGYMDCLVQLGRRGEAEEFFKIVKSRTTPAKVGFCFVALGDLDSAFTYFDRALEAHDSYLAFLRVEPIFGQVRADSRFDPLLAGMNFPDQPNELERLKY